MRRLHPPLEVRPIDAGSCLPLRRLVLWPRATLAEVMLAEDASGLHLGGFVAGTLCCVASFFVTGEREARLRKFATEPSMQGRGLGSAVLRDGARRLDAQGIETLWLDARDSAWDFYRRRGFRAEGEPFCKGEVRYRRLRGSLRPLLDA